MSGYIDNDQGPVKEPTLKISMRTAVAISLVTGVLLIAILYFKGA